MLHEYDGVRLKKALPKSKVPVGADGVIVMMHDNAGQVYEVEFFDQDRKTIDICTVIGDEYLEKVTHRNKK